MTIGGACRVGSGDVMGKDRQHGVSTLPLGCLQGTVAFGTRFGYLSRSRI
jgi:hypothetical protein